MNRTFSIHKVFNTRLLGVIFFCSIISPAFSFAQQNLPFKDLTVGNKFFYENIERGSPNKRIMEFVVRDTIINNTRYAVLNNSLNTTLRFERSNDTAIFEWYDNTEWLTHKFSAKAGDTIRNVQFFGFNFPVCVVKNVDRIRNPRTGDSLGFVDVAPNTTTIGYTFGYAQVLGMIGCEKTIPPNPSSPNNSVWYKGALIKGKVFGDTTFIVTSVGLVFRNSTLATLLPATMGLATPNPFSTSTSLAYSLSQRGTVTAAVYSIEGLRVATLLPPTLQIAGDYTLQWNGNSSAGGQAAAGQYYVVLFVDDRNVASVSVVKM